MSKCAIWSILNLIISTDDEKCLTNSKNNIDYYVKRTMRSLPSSSCWGWRRIRVCHILFLKNANFRVFQEIFFNKSGCFLKKNFNIRKKNPSHPAK